MFEYKTKCGGIIRINHKTQEHLKAHPEVKVFLGEAIMLLCLPNQETKIESVINLGRVVGKSSLVPTAAIAYDEVATFAQRKGRSKVSRVAEPNIIGPICSTIVIIANPTSIPKTYDLVTSWIGELASKEPWDLSIRDEKELQRCLDFWSSHALEYDPAVMGEISHTSWKTIMNQARNRQV